MIYFLEAISGFLSGLGIGGGAVFILFSTLFNLLDINNSRAYNLIIFVSFGISLFFKEIKNKKMINLEYFITLIEIVIGCVIGYFLNRIIPEKPIKVCFYIFMIIIGIYELVFGLIGLKNGKNNKGKE